MHMNDLAITSDEVQALVQDGRTDEFDLLTIGDRVIGDVASIAMGCCFANEIQAIVTVVNPSPVDRDGMCAWG